EKVVQAVAPQAVVLENTANSQALGHAINLHSTQPVKSVGKSGQAKSTSAEANNFATTNSEKTSPEELNSAKTATVIEANPKTITSKADTTVKKTQRTSTENQSDATAATTTSHRQEVHAVSSSQD